MKTLVAGDLILDDEEASFKDATVYVTLEDVSRADAKSSIVAKQKIHPVSHHAGAKETVRFELDGKIVDDKADYIVRAHVDLDGDGQIRLGHYITTQSYPVLTFGRPNRLTVRVQKVR